jgi:hypothetical protein
MELADHTAFFLSNRDSPDPTFDERGMHDGFEAIFFPQIINQEVKERMEL